MAYLNLNSDNNFDYKIYQNTNIDNFFNDYIEVDDMIAPIIQILNMKGYRTKACCAGHPFTIILEMFTDIREELYDCRLIEEVTDKDRIDYFVSLTGEELDGKLYRGISEVYVDFYIAFEDKMPDKFLPKGFKWDENCIRYEFENEGMHDFIGFLEEQLDVIKRLYKWVDELEVIL